MANAQQIATVEETSRVANQITASEAETRRRKTERLREARMAAEST